MYSVARSRPLHNHTRRERLSERSSVACSTICSDFVAASVVASAPSAYNTHVDAHAFMRARGYLMISQYSGKSAGKPLVYGEGAPNGLSFMNFQAARCSAAGAAQWPPP